jgi:hypothetical protein
MINHSYLLVVPDQKDNLTSTTGVLDMPEIKGSKKSARFCIAADVINLKNITPGQG